MFKLFLITLSMLILSGCVNVVTPNLPKVEIKLVESKNFQFNQVITTYVGEIMIKEKKYYVRQKSGNQMESTHNFTMISPVNKLHGSENEKYEIMGTINLDNKQYKVLFYEKEFYRKNNGLKLLINEENYLHNKILNSEQNIEVVWNHEITPKQVEFREVEEAIVQTDVLKDKPYINYEIVFSGISNNTIRMLYREFTVEDYARPSFYQELTYPTSSSIIRFKDLKLKITGIEGDKISFIVESK